MSFWLGEKTHLKKKKKPDLNQVLSGFFGFFLILVFCFTRTCPATGSTEFRVDLPDGLITTCCTLVGYLSSHYNVLLSLQHG
jgi:hypothetical protein